MTEQQKFGVNVWWSVPSMILDSDAVKDILEKHGFERRDIPTPSRRTEVSRACYSFQNRRHQTKRRITEKTQDNGKFLVYGILDQNRKDSEHVGFRQTTTVYLDKDSGSVRVDGALSDKVLEAVHRYEGKVTEDDIRLFLRDVIRMCFGIAKRPSGGIYFVPSRFSNIIQSAQAVLNDIGHGARLYIEGIIDGVQEREIVWEAVENDIDTEIQQALMSAERIEKSAKAVNSQKAKLERMNEIVEVYKGLLGKEAHYESLAERIEEAVQKVSEKISDIQKSVPVKSVPVKSVPVKSVPVKSATVKSVLVKSATVKSVLVKSATVKSVRKTTAKKRATKPSGSKVCDAAVDVLKAEGKPMHYKAITKAITENGSYSGSGKYAADSVRKIVDSAIQGGDARVKIVGRGVYQAA